MGECLTKPHPTSISSTTPGYFRAPVRDRRIPLGQTRDIFQTQAGLPAKTVLTTVRGYQRQDEDLPVLRVARPLTILKRTLPVLSRAS